jgi:hypothetical protein
VNSCAAKKFSCIHRQVEKVRELLHVLESSCVLPKKEYQSLDVMSQFLDSMEDLLRLSALMDH